MDDEQAEIISKTEEHIKRVLDGDGTGHDWWHIDRVRKNALAICDKEQADPFIVNLGALLHDIADWKFHDGDENAGPRRAREWLEQLGLQDDIISIVCDIVYHVSFKGAGVASQMTSVEGKIVQDADRLDAVGAIGIARAFAYGGSKNREIFSPDISPTMHNSFEEYKKSTGTTINHFYEKLLLLKNLINTDAAKEIAAERHAFIEEFLEKFHAEWQGRRYDID